MDLVNASAHFVAAERHDDPLDLPPVAESHDIARIPALFCSDRSLEPGIVAEALDKIGRVGKRAPAGDEGQIHAVAVKRAAVSGLRTIILNTSLTIKKGALRGVAIQPKLLVRERGLGQ